MKRGLKRGAEIDRNGVNSTIYAGVFNFLRAIIYGMFTRFVEDVYSFVANIPFDTLVWLTWGSYFAVFLIAFVLTFASKSVKTASKRPFLSLTNAYTAVNLSVYLLKCEIGQSVLISAIFWTCGYVLYGALCAASKAGQKKTTAPEKSVTILNTPVAAPAAPPARQEKFEVPAAKNNVRLEHAASVTEKLLSKNLGKSDRQELEKIKNTLAVLKIKGTLSATETEILNENFNTLLKLMAKYNV